MTYNKKDEIFAANAVLCILVMFIHISSMPITSLQKDSIAYLSVFIPWRLSSFVVQAFIFLSATKLFMNGIEEINYRKYYTSRLKKIVIPYIIWVIVYYIYFCYENYFTFNISRLIKEMALGTLVSPFYFIITIIQFYALMPLWRKIYKSSNIVLLVLISLAITIIFGQYFPKILNYVAGGYTFRYNDRVFTTYMIYWTLGAICGLNYDKFTCIMRNKHWLISISFLILAIVDVYFAYRVFAHEKSVSFLETFHVLYCLSAIMLLMNICQIIKKIKILNMIGKVNYSIFLSHCLVIFITNKNLYLNGVTSIKDKYIISILSVYGITLSCCLACGYIKNIIINKQPNKNIMEE